MPDALFWLPCNPDLPGSAPPARPTRGDAREGISRLASEDWCELLAECWRGLAGDSKPLLERATEHEILAYAGLALHSVERGLVDVVRDPAASPAVGPRGSIWCAAQALDASALAWQRLHPEAGWRYDALGMRLEREMAVHSRFALTATYVAATSRRANAALEQPASGVEPLETALKRSRPRRSPSRPPAFRRGWVSGRAAQPEVSSNRH